jgi:predicted GIY-YIG superfamily endonuclease
MVKKIFRKKKTTKKKTLKKTSKKRGPCKGKSICYILKSLNPKYPKKTYCGVTNDMERRLRQHNKEIQGGARTTKYAGPWKVAATVSGFESRSQALSFEWFMHHPSGKPDRKGYLPGLEGRFKLIRRFMSHQKFINYPLKLNKH